VYYNKAWEAYTGNTLTEAMTQVNKTLAHKKVNDFLKAKAYVLRGAIYYRQGNESAARADFQQAIVYDPDGPIGRMAQANLVTEVAEGQESDGLPAMIVLAPNYPNPFNPETNISFGLDKAGQVELTVYNIVGEQVRKLTKGHYAAGWYMMKWNGTNDKGTQVGSGTYLLRLQVDNVATTRKMILVR
jgi:tetratricopeptide (TPR) repeat protein